jgi:myosin heavy subunit
LQDLKDDQQQLEQQNSELTKEKDQMYSRLQDAETSLEASKRDATEALNAAHERSSAVESELRSMTHQYKQAIDARDEKVHELSVTIDQLRESQSQQKKDFEDLTTQCEQHQNRSYEAEDLLQKERGKASRQSDDIARLEAQVMEHQHQLEGKEAELEDALRQLHVLRTSYQELEESSAEMMKELVAKHASDLNVTARRAEDERKELEAQLHNAQNSARQERHDHEKTRSDVQFLQASIPPLEARIQELEEFCREQEEELEEFRTAQKMMAMHLRPTRPASRTFKEIAQPQTVREPRTHRRRKSAINTQEGMPKAQVDTQELPDQANEHVTNASFASSADSNSSLGGGPTPKRARPRPTFKVPTMQTPYTQKPDSIPKPVLHSRNLSSSKRALRPVSPNRRHTTAEFKLPDSEREGTASELGSVRKSTGSLQAFEQTDFDIEDEFATGTPLTPGFMSGTGRMPVEDDETMTEL